MVKIIFVGDLHATYKQVSGRIDNYWESMKVKLNELVKIANDSGSLVIFTGDMFHKPKQDSHLFMGEMTKIMNSFDITPMTIIGNHDVQYNQYRYLDSSAIGELLLNGCIKELTCIEEDDDVVVWGRSFVSNEEIVPENVDKAKFNILVGHYYHETTPFAEPGNKEIITDSDMSAFDMTILGHDHTPYDPQSYTGGIMYRMGSFGRVAADRGSINERDKVQVLQFEKEEDNVSVNLIPIESCRDPKEIFNFEAVNKYTNEQYQEIQSFVKKFSNLIKGGKTDLKQLCQSIIDTLEDLDQETKEKLAKLMMEKLT